MKILVLSAVFALAIPVLTVPGMAQPDRGRDSTFQRRAEGRPHEDNRAQRMPQNRAAMAPNRAAPPQPAAQPPQQLAQQPQNRAERSGRFDRGPGDRSRARPDNDQRSDFRRDRGPERGAADRRPDRRPDVRPDFRDRRPGFDRNRSRRDWGNWRRDHHDWRPSRRFHAPSYHRPNGWYYRRWSYGDILPSLFWSSQYWISNWSMYDLPPPPPGAIWVRYGDDAVLIDRFSGEVIDVVYDFFY
ncbi:MAG TPA: RcnB family protein [Rhizomicrobium sp.]|nr:RcnB family protein [Rhizomicrobium sp.]